MKTDRLYLVVILVLILSLQFAAALQKSFWEDETFAARRAEAGYDQVQAIQADDHPLLMSYMMSAWGSVMGYDEIGLRSLSILFAFLTLLLTYELARGWFGDRIALAAVALLGFSPLFVLHAHNARDYSLSALLALLAVLGMDRFQATGRKKFLILYVAGGLVFLSMVFSSVILLVACNLWFVVGWLLDKNRKANSIVGWLAAQIVIVILYFPLANLLTRFASSYFEMTPVTNVIVEMVKRGGYLGYTFMVGGTLSPLNPIAWLGTGILAALSLFALQSNIRNRNFWLCVFLTLFIGGASTFASILSGYYSRIWQNLPHWAFYALPFWAIWLSSGFTKARPRAVLLVASLVGVVYLASIYNYFAGKQFLQPAYAVPWKSIMEKIRDEAGPEATVICSTGDAACGYYLERYGFPVYYSSNWAEVSKEAPDEVWWIQTNTAQDLAWVNADIELVDQLATQYAQREVYNYGLQDPSIRWIKLKYMNQKDYEYRVILYRLYNP